MPPARPFDSMTARLSVALVAVAVAQAGTQLFSSIFEPMRFLLLWCAVMLSALVGGTVAGVVAVILSAVSAAFILFPPAGALEVAAIDLARIIVFAVAALTMVWIIDARARAERRALEAVGQQELRFRQLADSAPVLVWISDRTRECTFFNRGWLEFTGRTLQQEIGHGWVENVHPDDVERCFDTYSSAFDGREPFRMEYRLRRHDGVYRWLLDTGTPRYGTDGEFEGYSGACSDVTEEREARERLAAANQAKDQFLATLSHELRTPLTAILGWTRMLRIGQLDPETTTAALETIERSARSQQSMIDDLLDVSLIVSGGFATDRAPSDVTRLVAETVETLRPTAAARRVELAVHLPEEPIVATIDSRRFRQVVWHLASNAVKFNRVGGHVDVRLEVDAKMLTISVADDGNGIDPAFLPHVFERFRQADGSSTRAVGGLGIGLSIVKELVELHGGTVTVSSAGVGRGATFVAAFPRVETTERLSILGSDRRPAELHGSRILIVDDDADTSNLMRTMLEIRGATVFTAANADEALVALNRERPSLLISSVGTVSNDDYSLAGRIRNAPRGAHVPMIAIGPIERSQDERKAIAAGFNRLLTNPVDPQMLAATAAELMGR